MANPREMLAADEELLLHRHPHWKMLVVPSIVFVVATAVAGYLLGLTAERTDGTVRTVLLVVIGVVWAALVIWQSLIPLLRWRTTHFLVTDRRVLIRQGILTQSGIDIPMGRISNVQFRHGPLDRLLRTGTLIIVASSDDPLEFDDVPQVERVHSLLYHQVFDAMDLSRDRDDQSGS